eukprot:s2757_g15.t1
MKADEVSKKTLRDARLPLLQASLAESDAESSDRCSRPFGGQPLEFYSKTAGRWLPCEVISVRSDLAIKDQRVRIRISYAKGSIAELRVRAPQVVELPDYVPILPRFQADEKWPLVTKVEVLKKWKARSGIGYGCPPEPMPTIVTGKRQDRRFYGKALKDVPRWDPSPADYAFVGEGMLLVFSPDGRRAVRDRDSPMTEAEFQKAQANELPSFTQWLPCGISGSGRQIHIILLSLLCGPQDPFRMHRSCLAGAMGLTIMRVPAATATVSEPAPIFANFAYFTPAVLEPILSGHVDSVSAVVCGISAGIGLEKRRRRKGQRFLPWPLAKLQKLFLGPGPRTVARAHNDGRAKSTRVAQDDVISNGPLNVFENDRGSTGVAVLPNPSVDETKVQWDIVGACIIGACALPAWHVLPIFLDLKIAADPGLPGLTQDTLPIATTAIFVGWLASATMLDKALEIFDQKQLLVLHIIGLLMVVLATVTLPYLTAGNLIVFTAIRFVYGLLMNITALQCMYIQERLPKEQGNQVLVLNSIGYCVATMLMAWSCSGLTLAMDWRFEAIFWCSAPLILALAVGLPDCWKIMQSLPVAVGKKLHNIQKPKPAEVGNGERQNLTFAENRHIVALAVAFLACGCGFYGLNYSAGQLSPDIYMSCILLHGGDILGYLLALTADKYGRNNVQAAV